MHTVQNIFFSQNKHGAQFGGKFYNVRFHLLLQISGLRMPPTKSGLVDPEPRLSIARRRNGSGITENGCGSTSWDGAVSRIITRSL